MTKVVGCTLGQAKSMNIDKALWKELESLATENPTTSTEVWGDKEEFILFKYYPKTTTPAVRQMLEKINPDVNWTDEQIRSKCRRMGLKKEAQ
jgi:hypothetical protein